MLVHNGRMNPRHGGRMDAPADARADEREGLPMDEPGGGRRAGYGVQLVQTVGHPFDSRTMHAMEARRVERSGDGTVVEELQSGFTRDGEVLRLADVAVNRRPPQG